jgi:hypothetical protein
MDKLASRAKYVWLLSVLLASGALVLVFFAFSGYLCPTLLLRSIRLEAITLPQDCQMSANVQTDDKVRYLENDRVRRRLIFKGWITCKQLEQASAREFIFLKDPRWLPSYVPGTYQFRRTVILFPGHPVPKGSRVVAEVCLMGWRKYISQIAGQCGDKFSVWK